MRGFRWHARGLSRVLFGGWAALVGAADLDPARVEFFENRVRPVLVEHCYECHSGAVAKPKGGLRLDTAAGVLAGGTAGVVVVPGKPAESLLIQAIQGHARDLDQMPPKDARGGGLKPEQIAALEEWVRTGAVDPRTAPTAAAPPNAAATHWAFRAPQEPKPPAVTNSGWIRRPLDRFVLAQMEAHGLKPSAPADPRTLFRRATLDLTGLPPTPAEMETFLADKRPDAYVRAVDRLLGSPRYGERWGRIWLDVARYADTKGYVFEEERRYPYSYTYRDWVVQALNDDLPYDRFLQYQIAGDLYATPENPAPLAALGFLTLGRRFLNNQADIIDDRIDVIFRGTQALTVQCARCHDHKFDPIPTADYYSLYGVFQSTHEPAEKPLLGASPNPDLAAEYETERTRRVTEREKFRAERTAETVKKMRDRVGDYLITAQESLTLDGTQMEGLARTRSLDPGLVGAWKDRLVQWQSQTHPVFAPWFALLGTSTNDLATLAGARLKALSATNSTLNRSLIAQLSAQPLTNHQAVAIRYSEILGAAEAAWQSSVQAAITAKQTPPVALADPEQEQLRLFLSGPDSPIEQASKDIDRFFDVPTAQKSRALQRQIEELEATHRGSPRRAMALVENDQPTDPVIFKRGNAGNPGAKVPRQFLSLVAGPDRKPFARGSGRRELAEAITDPRNPLTARVMVNRIWLRHFGAPLVSTPSDFGLRSDPPSNPALLDHLALAFQKGGWSLKNLHRELLLSATYQQASSPTTAAEEAVFVANEARDPGNLHYWRQNRRRLEFEGLRDSLLAVSGRLDPSMGGQPVEMYGTERPTPRRSLYGFVDRQNLPGILRAFDFASPDATSSGRFQTTVPQQALYFLNSESGADLARQVARHSEPKGTASDEARIQRLYRLLFQRAPTREEERLGLAFVADASRRPLEAPEPIPAAAWSYGWGRVDDATQRVAEFNRFTVFRDDAWRPDDKFPLPDARSHLKLQKTAGHPGRDAAHSVIRRWTSAVSGQMRLGGRLRHEERNGDGVRARLISSRLGVVQEWVAQNTKVDTRVDAVAVEPGDTLDLVIDCRGGEDSDSFNWNPSLTLKGDPRGRSWRADADFSGPLPVREPLTPWARYSQVLLSANEFVFVD